MALIDSIVHSGLYMGMARTLAASASARVPALALKKKGQERLNQAIERCVALITASFLLEALPTKIFEAYSFNKIITWAPVYLIPLALLGLNYPGLTENTLYLVQIFSITYSIAALIFAPSILTVAGGALGLHSAFDSEGKIFKELENSCGNIGILALKIFGALGLLFSIKKAVLSISVQHVLIAGFTLGFLAFSHAKKGATPPKEIPEGYESAHEVLIETYLSKLIIAFQQVFDAHLKEMASALGREMSANEKEYVKELIKYKWRSMLPEKKSLEEALKDHEILLEAFDDIPPEKKKQVKSYIQFVKCKIQLIESINKICGNPRPTAPQLQSLREDWIFARFTFSITQTVRNKARALSSGSLPVDIQAFFLSIHNENTLENLLSNVHRKAFSMASTSIRLAKKPGHESLLRYDKDHQSDLAHAAFEVITF